MNDDLISRSALKKALEVTQYNDIDDLTRTERLIDNAPTVESDKELNEKIETYKNAYRTMSDAFENEVRKNRPRGEWITWKEAGNYIASPNRHECSCCHDSSQVLVNGIELLSDFCPNCGADMRGEADNLCDNCKLADTCTASLKGCIGCKTTKCFRHEWAEKEAENEQTTD